MADGACSAMDHEGHKVLIQRDRLGREVRRHVYAGQVDIESRYDAMDQLAEQRVARPGNGALEVLARREWRYDLNDRVTQIDDQRWGTTSYRYDRLGQLTEARTGSRVEVFDYDPNGSLERILTELGGSRMRWEVGGGNRLRRTDTARYEDDERGRRVTKIEFADGGDPGPERVNPGNLVTHYAWDSRDRLREVLLPDGRKARYQYDAFGRRVRKEIVPAARADFAGMLALATKDGVDALPKIERTEFIWDGNVVAQEIRSGDAPAEKTYVHEPGTFVPMLHEEQGAVFTYVVDHLGTPKKLIDRDGRVAWAGSFSAWGKEAEEYRDPKCRWRVEVPWRLLGQYADAETGLCSTRFRYFDAEAGRWLSADPLGLAGGKNLHAFDGAPSVEVDPWGLACEAEAVTVRLQELAAIARANMMRNLNLSRRQRDAAKAKPWLKRAFFGSAVENELNDLIQRDKYLSSRVRRLGGPNAPDFIDERTGTVYDLTTDNPRTVKAHEARATRYKGHGEPLVITTYSALTDDEVSNLQF